MTDVVGGALDDEDWAKVNDLIREISHDVEGGGGSVGHDEKQDVRAELRRYVIKRLKEIGDREAE